MGKKVRTVITLIDDLDGRELEEGQGQTVTFALDGTNYEIDLSDENAEQARKLLEPLIEAGRKAPGSKRKSRAGQGTVASRQIGSGASGNSGGGATHPPRQGETLSFTAVKHRNNALRKEVRQWANERGMDQAEQGRIREDVIAAWNEAHPDRPVPEYEGKNALASRLQMVG